MKRVLLAITALVTFTTTTLAQELTPVPVSSNDFRARAEGSFEWEIIEDLSLEAGLQFRLNNDLGSVDCFHTSLGLEYDLGDHVTLGAEYILINGYKSDKKVWDKPRHRINVNVGAGMDIGRFELSIRERLQTTCRTDSVNRYEKPKCELILRSRLMAQYNIRHSKWSPYLFYELHNTLNAPAVTLNYKTYPFEYDNYITRHRIGLGTKYRITHNHRLEFFYYFDYDSKIDIGYRANQGYLKSYEQKNEFRHIFGVSYKFKL
jgi:opacity protein-like surface antigen